MTAEPRQLAECRTFEALRKAFRRRIDELGITYETVDHIAGFTTRYTSKLMSPDLPMNMGIISMETMLGVLGLKLLVVEDADALALVASRHLERQRPPTRSALRPPFERVVLNGIFMSTIGHLGGKKSAEKRRTAVSRKKALSEQNRRNVLKRWRTPIVTEITPAESSRRASDKPRS